MKWLVMVRIVVLAGIGLLLLSLPVTGFAQSDDFTPNDELVAQMDRLEARTSAIRGLDGLDPVTRLFPTRADVIEFVNSQLEGEETVQLYRDAGQFYIAFDLLPPDADLLVLYRDFLGDQVGGYYDPETREMNVVLLSGSRPSSTLPALEQITYAHEYTHALQDQHFGLDAFLPDELAETNPDAYQARLSLVEGDATAVMTDYTQIITQEAPLLVLTQVLIQGAASGSLTIPAGTPPILEDELLFPYLTGSTFVNALRAEGGWALVDAAYTTNPPLSTEQIMHPEKYLAGDVPQEVTLLPDATLTADGWTLLFDRPLGEFFLRQYLDTQLSPLEVIEAGAGWGGDRYHLYVNPTTGERAWVLRLVWDTPQDADEFAENYTLFGDRRFGSAADADGCWQGAADAVCFITVDDASLVSYAPTVELALALRSGQQVPTA